jgi:Uma2 family endonuclease
MEYVDGVLVERNVGDWFHSQVQSNVIFALRLKYRGIHVLPEIRSRVNPTRFRLPDVAVLLSKPKSRVLTDAPFIAIEILSEEDRVTRLVERLREFVALGTPHIWVIDPRLKLMYVFRNDSLQAVEGDALATDDPCLELTREEVFLDLDTVESANLT